MVRVVRKENNKPIHVAICGIKSAVFAQYQQELQGIGYQLSFEPNVQEAGRVSGSDICIVECVLCGGGQTFLPQANIQYSP